MYHNIPDCKVLKAIEMVIPAMAIASLGAKSQTTEKGKRSLPAQLVARSLVIRLSFWSSDSMRDVFKNVIDEMSEVWLKIGTYWRLLLF